MFLSRKQKVVELFGAKRPYDEHRSKMNVCRGCRSLRAEARERGDSAQSRRAHLQQGVHREPRPGLGEVRKQRLEADTKPVPEPPSRHILGVGGPPHPLSGPREAAVFLFQTFLKKERERQTYR